MTWRTMKSYLRPQYLQLKGISMPRDVWQLGRVQDRARLLLHRRKGQEQVGIDQHWEVAMEVQEVYLQHWDWHHLRKPFNFDTKSGCNPTRTFHSDTSSSSSIISKKLRELIISVYFFWWNLPGKEKEEIPKFTECYCVWLRICGERCHEFIQCCRRKHNILQILS